MEMSDQGAHIGGTPEHAEDLNTDQTMEDLPAPVPVRSRRKPHIGPIDDWAAEDEAQRSEDKEEMTEEEGKEMEEEEMEKSHMDFSQYFTYSEAFAEKYKANTKNRIALLNRPMENWVGITKEKTNWTKAPWHAIGIAWIQTPNTTSGKDLVVFDVEGLTPDDPDFKKWRLSSMPIIRSYVDFCGKPNSKRKINRAW
ncbi:hypothetical protein MMC07_000003 [Pseudocyphellaria aurata]|nr:hypothetical protein [Pseudocyphellaria aurata]